MKSGRRMRTAHKMRRIYTFTVLAWVLGIVVFWLVGALHTMASSDLSNFSSFDPDGVAHYIIYFILLFFALIAVLLIEYLIFGRKSSSRGMPTRQASLADLRPPPKPGNKRSGSRRRSTIPDDSRKSEPS